jgi:hypothetical protein
MLTLRRVFGRFTQSVDPQHSHCYRCGITWGFAKNHCTRYSDCEGCFPLCEYCWRRLTPQGRLPFYRRLFESWGPTKTDWIQIHNAVLAGE